ncbi:hypothetical protein AB1Y20_015988 [Prymnesium parvum]|uniref:Uncharacterized protein n=1 Tax=Prymnesium parvum TaxID=97485 RepID=A0AB34K1T7_PRYPA
MLFADKAALENRTKVRLLAIRERELTLYTNNCRTVGTVAAVMAGLAFSALIYTKMAYFQDATHFGQLCYATMTIVSMSLSLRIVLGTTMLTMLGPGKALRGPDGSMHSAVDGMLDEYEKIALAFHGTIWSFMLTAIAFAWTAATRTVLGGLLLTALIGFLTFLMFMRTQLLERQFPLRTTNLVSGAFFADSTRHRFSEDHKPAAGAPTEAEAYPPPPPLTGGYARVQQQAAHQVPADASSYSRGRPRDPAKQGFTPLR